jgi:hypothetical protein
MISDTKRLVLLQFWWTDHLPVGIFCFDCVPLFANSWIPLCTGLRCEFKRKQALYLQMDAEEYGPQSFDLYLSWY